MLQKCLRNIWIVPNETSRKCTNCKWVFNWSADSKDFPQSQHLHSNWFKSSSEGWSEKKYVVKLGDKERFDKEQIGVKELFTDYQPVYTINQLLDRELLELLPI